MDANKSRLNWDRIRNWKTLSELTEQINIYFNENEEFSIEMLYLHLGVTKDNVYDWANRGSSAAKKKAELIIKAKEAIHSDLAHEIKNAKHQAKSQLLYLKSRFKDDMLDEEKAKVEGNISISFGNAGDNSIE